MINLTESAQKELKRLATRDGLNAPVVVLGVDSGGCSGFSYRMGMDTRVQDGYEAFAYEGLTVACAPDALPFFRDMEIDFSKDLIGGGFKFRNPNAKGTCSCGTSFRV